MHRDLDQILHVLVVGLDLFQHAGDQLGVGQGAEVHPGLAQVAGVGQEQAHLAARGNVRLLDLAPQRLGQVVERAGQDHRQPELQPGPHQQRIE